MPIADVVKYNGGPGVYAWKFPREDLAPWTQLIVNESQEAILFKNGEALDIFRTGRHVLEAAAAPLLRGALKTPFGDKTPFTAEVWFINMAHALDIKWGTATPAQIQDPRYGVFVPVRAHGQFGIRIEESKKFLLKLVGTLPVFDQATLTRHFRGLYMTKVKDALSTYLMGVKISILEINAYLEEISGYLRERVAPLFAEYGIELINFCVNDISVPEDDFGVRKLKYALARKAEMAIISERPGVCPACAAPLSVGGGKFCPQCGAPLSGLCPGCGAVLGAGVKFCPDCGRRQEG
ncbi:MAG: SPFH domain-containing protein [Peptococcaceae bacterium]|nr:SPFH domain-containing protein [Peptococcaceae bacterium]